MKESAVQEKVPESAPAPAVSQLQPRFSGRRTVHPILRLQLTIGNQAVQHFIQAKLKVGAVSDDYEKEADRFAEEVVGESGPLLKCACGGVAGLDGMCVECRKKTNSLHRRNRNVGTGTANGAGAPQIV